jgi:lipopolysaccharide transport system ATP-binding protein
MRTVISVEDLSKSYRLGQISTGTFTYDLQLWWAKVRGKPHPWQTIGEPDDRERDGEIIWALKDVSFNVEQGEVLGIIGRNGAGKSTLLKILSRVTAPTSGKVKIKGRIASLLEVGTGFHPDLTGRENVYLNGAIMGMDKQEVNRKFDEIVNFSGVEKFIDTPVKRYSSGMYVRLAFAVAAHLEPEILVVDEVLAVGDAEFQKKCLGKMGEVAKEGRTVLFVSHNMGAVTGLCNSGILLSQGKIVNEGEVGTVVDEYIRSGIKTVSGEFSRPRTDCTNRITITEIDVDPPLSFDDPLQISVGYVANTDVERFSVEWFIRDIYGQRILSGLSVSSDRTWFVPQDKFGKIVSTMDHWRLHGGQYSISVIICLPGIECMDYVENAVIFTIGDQSPKGTKFIFSSRYGYLLPEVSWRPLSGASVEVEQLTKPESQMK